jgi:hypothetical protein
MGRPQPKATDTHQPAFGPVDYPPRRAVRTPHATRYRSLPRFTLAMKEFPALFLAGAWATAALWTLSIQAGEGKPTHLLRSERKPGAIDQVVVLLEVGGELKEKDKAAAKSKPVAMSAVCNLDYDEKTLEVPTRPAGRWRSVRCYQKASAVLKMGDDGVKPSLRPQRSLIGAQIDSEAATLFSLRGPLRREELELIDVLGNSLLLDQLLPDAPASPGDTWKHADRVVAVLLGLDAVRQSDVQSVLKEVTDTVARFEMSGRVEGTVNDVSSTIELKAKYRFDLRNKRIDWLGLVLQEQREISEVEAGFDVAARLQVRITPQDGNPALEDAKLEGLSLEATAEATQLQYESAEAGWQLTHDRRWHLIGSHHDLAIFKHLAPDGFVAQCNVSPLAKRPLAELPSLEDFQQDVRKALGESFGEFAQAGQASDEANHRIYRVVVHGKVSEVPIQWNYYLVADQQGRQAAFAFTIKKELAERLQEADEKLVHAIRFFEPKAEAGEKK